MQENINDELLLKISSEAFMSKDNEDMKKNGTLFNFNQLKLLIKKLDKKIWINNIWYSLNEPLTTHYKNYVPSIFYFQ